MVDLPTPPLQLDIAIILSILERLYFLSSNDSFLVSIALSIKLIII